MLSSVSWSSRGSMLPYTMYYCRKREESISMVTSFCSQSDIVLCIGYWVLNSHWLREFVDYTREKELKELCH